MGNPVTVTTAFLSTIATLNAYSSKAPGLTGIFDGLMTLPLGVVA